MAKKKMKKKSNSYEVDQFNASDPISEWPEGVIANVLSSTGYSYGTLQMIPAPIGGGQLTRDGFEIADGQWIVIQGNSTVFMADTDTVQKYLDEDL